ncbi:hypothetical protein B0J17DRAFT_721746 [Rhizoctonia solani]|nr:hypothetical protein B0J17DRAFT_721746 [Rhizoctonia solani]
MESPELAINVEAKIKVLLACVTMTDLKFAIKALVTVLQTCADNLLKIDAGVVVDVDAKASIVTCISAIIILLVKVCLQLSVRFGITVVAALFADIDVCLQSVLVNLNICVDGILVLIAKALVLVTLHVCAEVLGKLGLQA